MQGMEKRLWISDFCHCAASVTIIRYTRAQSKIQPIDDAWLAWMHGRALPLTLDICDIRIRFVRKSHAH